VSVDAAAGNGGVEMEAAAALRLVSPRDEQGVLRVMPSVYSFAFPETNAVFDASVFPPELWRVSADRALFDEVLAARGLGVLPSEGERKLGLLDLVHVPIVDGIIEAVTGLMPGFADAGLVHRYPLHGSAQGIGLLLTHLRTQHAVSEIHVLAGDYEGYASQAAQHGVGVVAVTLEDAWSVSGGTWFVSSPSAVDGAPLPDGFVEDLIGRADRVIVDVAYHGLAGRVPAAVPAGTFAWLWSLSKPWGLFWRRVGVLACVEPVGAAYAQRWFKDPGRLLAAFDVVSRFEPWAMADRYRQVQGVAVEVLASAGLRVEAAETVLLACVFEDGSDPVVFAELAAAVRRPGVARVSLTPLLEKLLESPAR
jgi:hypothetical protein